jgi:hypothetical protein
MRSKRAGKLYDIIKSDVPFAALNSPNICGVEARTICQLLLCQILCKS